MKFTLIYVTVIISLSSAATAIAAPEIAVDRPTYDFGTISQGTKVEHTFTIRNKGNTPLTIKGVRPSCGCTAATMSASVIAPGKNGEIKASFNSTNYSGSVQKTVAVDSNDPKVPSAILNLKGTIIEDIQVTPKQLNLGQVKVNIVTKANISVANKGKAPLKLTAIRTHSPQIVAVSEKKLLKPGETGLITVSITPREGDRLVSSYLSITTDSPSKPEISVPIYGSLSH